jgi:hypothetical protein
MGMTARAHTSGEACTPRPARIRVRVPSGALELFDANHVHVTDAMVTATGRWRRAPQRSGFYSWPLRLIHEIRWTHEAARS